MSHARGQESNIQHSLSCNARVYSGIDLSKDEVTQTGKMLTKDEYDPGNDLGTSASNYSLCAYMLHMPDFVEPY